MNKLLILGATVLEVEIIEEAKKKGIYTIVTDNHEDWKLAPAKYIADEAWNISWTDFDSLKDKCLEQKISGILSGFSELRVKCGEKLSSLLGLPFYTKDSLFDVIYDKQQFKEACVNCDIRVADSYSINNIKKYPIIIKPVDNAGSRGIAICYTNEGVEAAYSRALSFSQKNKVIIEEYFKGDEVVCYFFVHNGIVNFLGICDRNMEKLGKNSLQLPFLYSFNSIYYDVFVKYNLDKFIRLIKYLNIKNGMIGFQSFVIGNDVIPYDPTYRLDGSFSYHHFERLHGLNPLSLLISYSLLGDDFESSKCYPKIDSRIEGCAYTYIILLKKGKVYKIDGLDKICKMKNFIHMRQQIFEGDVLEEDFAFSQIFARFMFICKDKSEIQEDIKYIRESLVILDSDSTSMIVNDYDQEDNLLINKKIV